MENNIAETVESKEVVRVHRIGTITAGVTLIGFGVMFILHFFIDLFTYEFILSFWPLILIGLGIEILVSTAYKGKKTVFDKGAVVVVILMAFLAIIMAGSDVMLKVIAEWRRYM